MMSTHQVASGTAHERILQDLRTRFCRQFPDAAPDLIDGLLGEALQLTSRSRVQQYRMILAERHVRNELWRRARR